MRRQEIEMELLELEKEEKVGALNLEQSRKRCWLKDDLLKMLKEEELYWCRRSHETWLLKGDNNTKFFHRNANEKKRKQTIFSLKYYGNHITGDENLIRHATDFYKKLFGPREGNAFAIQEDFWSSEDKVLVEENNRLEMEFSEDEIKLALDQMERNKTVGLDGFPIEFFQIC
jgi:4-hydroxyphenylpyruvate dioxygenase-like putative hemolysin